VTSPELVLRGPEVAQVAAALELALRTRRRNGHAPGGELRQLAAKVGQALPMVAACLPAILDAMGPEVAAMVNAQARGAAGSKTGARSAPLTCSEASGVVGVSARAVRSAAQAGRLVARKNEVTGEWLISPADLAGWMENRSRNAA
jgi:hypothetical protein